MKEELRRYHASVAADYLEKVRGMAMRIKSLNFAIEDLYQAASGVSGIDYAKELISTTASGDNLPSTIADIDALVEEMKIKQSIYKREIAAVERAINRMDDKGAAAIIEMHYVSHRSWRECSEVFHYSHSGMMKARTRALALFYDVMPETQIEEIPSAI